MAYADFTAEEVGRPMSEEEKVFHIQNTKKSFNTKKMPTWFACQNVKQGTVESL